MGAPRTLGVLLCLLALLGPHPLGVTARSLPLRATATVPVPATVPTTVPVPVPVTPSAAVPDIVSDTVPTAVPVPVTPDIVSATVPTAVPVPVTPSATVPTAVPVTDPVPTVAEEEEEDDEEEDEAKGRLMAALEGLAWALRSPPLRHRDPPGPETLLELSPELWDLLGPSLPPNLPPRGEA